MMSLEDLIEETTINLLRLAATDLPSDVRAILESSLKKETNAASQTQLDAIIRNYTLAKDTGRPMCQDTGVPIFYVEIGAEFPEDIKGIDNALKEATKKATSEVPLRPNAVDPIYGGNTGNNIGKYFPFINWEIIEGRKDLKLTVLPKGGGSENMSALGMLPPGVGIKGVKKFVLETVIKAGAQPCPPIVVGVGIGGGADICIKIAKKALLRPIGERHPEKEVADLEVELLEAINLTGIGAMGLGGDTTALDVKVDYAHRHPASLPVGVAIQCWAARSSSAVIKPSGEVKYLTHKV